MPQETLGFPVVALGASAGGLEAFLNFFSRVPADSGMAYIVASHLAPGHKSILAELISRRTDLPVEEVVTEIRLEPNRIFVMQPDSVLSVERGILRPISPADSRLRPPIDALFRSLAEDQRENAICVLLSGTGTDGTLGLRAVKEHGGMAMAQSIETARYDSILRSAINTGLVDHILPVEEMPQTLLNYAAYLRAHPPNASPDSREGLTELMEGIHRLLQRRTSHDFSRYKESTILRRLFRRMQVLQIHTVHDYFEVLQKDPREIDLLFRDLLIGVTHFFRDPEAFQVIEKEIVPKLFEEKGADAQVRVVVYGCASGEEAYSLAILLREATSRMQAPPRVQIFGTDIDEEGLETARAGRYPISIAEHMEPERLARFFNRQDDCYQVAKEIREMCIFSTHSLIKDPPFSRIDLISCRNVLIYLGSEVQRRIIPLFHYALRPGGFLFLGPSETINNHRELFRTVDKKFRIFQRKELVTRPQVDFPLGDIPRPSRPPNVFSGRNRTDDRTLSRAIERSVHEHHAPASVVMDEHGGAVYFSGQVGKFLSLQQGMPSHDALSLVREDLRLHVRAALHKVSTGEAKVVDEVITINLEEGVQDVRLTLERLKDMPADMPLYIAIFDELTPAQVREDHSRATQPGVDESVRQLENELRSTKEHLQTTIEELETSNEELRSSLEEFQSTNEELETSKEELQSLNEELETVNSELTRKITALDQANSDLQNLLESIQIATIFLDRDLKVKRFTPAIAGIFRLMSSDLGRPITDFAQQFVGADLPAEAKKAIATMQPMEREVSNADGDRWYMMRILPYRTEEGGLDGVVITFVDVTMLKQAEQEIREAKAFSDNIVMAVQTPLLVLDDELRVRAANRAFYQLFQMGEQGLEDIRLGEVQGAAWAADAFQMLARVVLESGEEIHGREIELRQDGRDCTLSVDIRYVQKQPTLLLLSIEDITERRASERALQNQTRELARSNAVLEQFAYAASHDLREPLRMITSYTQLLKRKLGDGLDPTAEQYFQFIVEGSTRMGSLLSSMLDFARAGHDVPRAEIESKIAAQNATMNLQALIEAADAKVEILEPLPKIHANLGTLTVIFQNLIANGIKYQRDGKPHVRISAEENGEEWIFRVQDNGIGIHPEDQERIFGLFKRLDTRKYPGEGIGLSVCLRLIEQYGGRIWVESEVGRGSTFLFALPK